MVGDPELKTDIQYEVKVPDDDLEDAKVHVRHAEDRIHALRARLKQHSPRKTETMTVNESTFSSELPTQTKVTRMKNRIAQLEAMIKDRDQVNLAYQEQLAILAGKQGVITGLRLGTDELRIRVSDAAGQLMESQEKTQNLKNQTELFAEGAKEMQKLQEEIRILGDTITSKDDLMETQNLSSNNQQIELAQTDAELVKLKQESETLSFQITDMTAKKDEELVRIRSEKQLLHDGLVRNGAEVTKMRNANEQLRNEFDGRVQHADALQIQLAEKDGEIATLQLQKKSLQVKVGELAAQRQLVHQYDSDLKECNEELERKKKQNNQLLENTSILNQQIASEKFRAESKEREYHDLEKKLLDYQNTLTGNTDKENALLEQLRKLEKESQDTNRKYLSEVILDDEMARENDNMKQQLAEMQTSFQQEDKSLRSRLDEKVKLERKMSEDNVRIKNELTEKMEESSKNEKMYLDMKKRYEEEKAGRKVRKVDYKKLEREMTEKIELLEKDAVEKDRRLNGAKKIEEQRANELKENEQRITHYGMELKKKDIEMEELQSKLSDMQTSTTGDGQEPTLKQRTEMEKMELILESWRQKAQENIRAEEYARSQMEAQNRLMQSREEMVKARNEKINTLKKVSTSNTSYVSTEASNVSHFGIQVTSVFDHRSPVRMAKYYKHNNQLHDHILMVNEDPEYILESELETIRRKKSAEEIRELKMRNRRPSLT